MAIVKMSNFSLFAFDSEKENLLHELQKFKYVHFLDQDKEEDLKVDGLKNVEVSEKIVAIEEEISKVSYAINILSKYHEKETGIKAMQEGQETYSFKELEARVESIDYNPLYDEIHRVWTEKENLSQEISKLKTEIEELNPWVDLRTPIEYLKEFKQSEVFLGTVPKALEGKVRNDLIQTEFTYFQVVSEDKDSLYILAISSKSEAEIVKEVLRDSSFSNVILSGKKTPDEEIKDLEDQVANLKDEILKLERIVKDLSKNLSSLQVVYDYLLNKKIRISASEKFLMTERVNVIKGFIPTEMADEFSQIVKKTLDNICYLEIEEADDSDPDIPILLENSKFTQSFEALTGMFSLPRYNEIDPTPYLAPFYLIFFGMMAADLGYGIVMLLGTFIVLKKFNLSETTKQFIRFFYYLSFSVIAWGAIYGSIFGGIIPMKGLIDPAEDYMSLLIISIIFGLIHVFFALGLKAYVLIRDGQIKDALFDVGFWYLALVGGIGLLVNILVDLPPIVATLAKVDMIVGMLGIVATGGRESDTIVGKIGGGIYELYGISGYVGDFVSYSRLMALGLAGGFIAGAVNMMAGMLAENGIIGIIGAALIFIFGQAFNLGLSLLGAYVHTIRLTFVEFFGKFYDGGGKSFNLFRSTPKYINLK